MKSCHLPSRSFPYSELARWTLLTLIVLLFVACSGNTNETVEQLPANTPSLTNVPVPTQSFISEPEVVESTAVAQPTVPSPPASLENGDFLVNLTSSTNDSDIDEIQLAVRQITIGENMLTFIIAFENNSTRPIQVWGIELLPEDFRLVDGTGIEYPATTVSDNLLTLVPMDGLPLLWFQDDAAQPVGNRPLRRIPKNK